MTLRASSANLGPIAPREALREAGSREIRIGSSNASTGSRVSVPIEMVANGDEMAVFANLVNISFDVSDKAPTGDTRILIEGSSVSDARAASLGTKTTNGVISIAGPNALSVEISGRVLIPGGAGLRNATVTLTDASGVSRSATTGTFGYYRIDGIAPGQSYTIAVTSRHYLFAPRQITPSESLTGLDLIAPE